METTKKDKNKGLKNVTIPLVGGRLPLPVSQAVNAVVEEYGLTMYLTTLQNLRLLGIREEALEEIKQRLAAGGVELKVPGKFPVPRVCVGRDGCKLGIIDTYELSRRIVEHFKDRTQVKPKYKIAIAACTANCSNAVSADIGIVATRSGYDIYVGGKGGPRPRAGRRIARRVDEETVLAVIEKLADFHEAKTKTKQRMFKLIDDPDFPFPQEV